MAGTEHRWSEPDLPTGPAFQEHLTRIAANRHSPEAAALYQILFDYVNRRVARLSSSRGRLSRSEQEEIVAEVLLQLMKGSLASFRGQSLPELLGFVRTITDRCTWRSIRSRDRENQALQDAGVENMDQWTGAPPRSVDAVEIEVESPLPEKDTAYLVSLLRAGSKAEYARRAGVSRAAVTQRVQRIKARIQAMSSQDRMTHDVWIRQQATAVLASEDGS